MPSRVRHVSVPFSLMMIAAFSQAHAGEVPDDRIFEDGFELVAPSCVPVQATIGSEGGALSLCGARLEVPPGAVAQPTTFGIERVDAPPPPPFDMSFVGPVFRSTPADAPLQQPLSITVSRTNAARSGLLRFESEFDEFVLIEACGVSDTHLQQYVWQLNTFSAARYIGDLPPSTQGLGDGTVAAVVDGVPRSYSVENRRAGRSIATSRTAGDWSRST